MIQPLSKYTSYIFTFLLTLGMILSVNIFAAEPTRTLGFQGQLYSHNLPLTSAVYATFTFYDAPTGGNTTGTPIAKTVTVNNGYFGTQFTESDTTGVDFNQQLYLEVSVNGTTLSPRTTVNPTVSSLKSFGTFSYASAPTVGAVGSLYFNSTSGELYVSNGTSWQLAGLASSTTQWVANGTSLNYMAGNVGIGTSTPDATLTIVGNATSTGTTLNVKNASGFSNFRIINNGNIEVGASTTLNGLSSSANNFIFGGKGDEDVNSVGRLLMVNNRPTPTSGDQVGLISFNSAYNAQQNVGQIAGIIEGNGGASGFGGAIRFLTKTDNGNSGERMRITHDGNIVIGTGGATTTSISRLVLQNASTVNKAQISLVSNRAALVVGSIIGGTNYVSNDTDLTAPGTTTASILALANQTHTASTLGTDLSFSVTTGTTTSEALRILGNGNIGIGTSSPKAKLDVGGYIGVPYYGAGTMSALISDDKNSISGLEIRNVNAGTAADSRFAVTDDQGLSSLAISVPSSGNTAGTIFGLTRSSSTLMFGNGTRGLGIGTLNSGDLTFGTNNTANITIKSGGNVGIGTTTPGVKFAVSGTSLFTSASTPQITINREGTSNASINFVTTSGSIYAGQGQNGSFAVSSDVNLATTTPSLFVGGTTAPGRVAINTNDPRFRFAINGTSGNGYFGITNSAFGDIFMINSSGFVGIGTTTPSQILVASGTIQSTALYGGATTLSTDANGNIIRTPSDQKLKTNVETLTSALDKVNAMRGVSYNWIDTNRFGPDKEIGFIAQELETIVPEVVKSGGEYKSVNYQNLTALLTEAIKELSQKVTWFKDDNKTLEVPADGKIKLEGEFCIDDVCMTKSEFKAMMLREKSNGGNSNTVNNTSLKAPTLTPESVKTDETVAEPAPQEQPPAPEPEPTPDTPVTE